jgi:hypothetical protein
MKQKLLDILKNPANKLIAVDLDWTLCEWEFRKDEDIVTPLLERIEFVNDLYKKWWHIIIWTARFPKWYQQTQKWLQNNWVLYHWIVMREKIGADLYIDDKSLNIVDII